MPRREIPKVEGAPVEHGVVPRPSPAAEKLAEPSKSLSEHLREKPFAAAHPKAETPVEMDKARRAQWRTTLQNAARKLAADRLRLDESEQAWASTVAEARTLGVPANVILAAAADANVELPE